jgi:hypothetical protein
MQLDVAEAQLVGGYLAQGIGPVPHLLELVHGALPVSGKVGDFSGAEEVAAGLDFSGEALLVVFLGFFYVAFDQEALAEDASQAGFAVFAHLVYDGFSVVYHIVIVLGVEAAFQDIELRRFLESVVVLALFKPVFGLCEVALRIVDVAQGKGRWCRIVRVLLGVLRQQLLGGFPVSVAVAAVAQLVAVLRQLVGVQVLGVDFLQFGGGVLVSAFVKEVLGQQETHLRHLDVLVVLFEESAGLLFCVLRLELEGRQGADGFCISAAVSLRLADGFCVVSVFIEFGGFLQVLSLCKAGYQQGCGQGRKRFFHVFHILTNLLKILIIFVRI